MDNNLEPKALTDLIENPSEISAIISDPAESGVQFYKALPNKDKQYVAFAAGIGLLAYGLFLNRSSKKSSAKASSSSANTSAAKPSATTTSTPAAGTSEGAHTGDDNK